MKTGGGLIKDDDYLTSQEQSMLDYVGVEGVVGMYYSTLKKKSSLHLFTNQNTRKMNNNWEK